MIPQTGHPQAGLARLVAAVVPGLAMKGRLATESWVARFQQQITPDDHRLTMWGRILAGMTGLSLATFLTGLIGQFRAGFEPTPQTAALVAAVTLLWVALGAALPQSLAVRLIRRTVSLLRREEQPRAGVLYSGRRDARDLPLLWMVLAVLLTSGGLAVLLSWALAAQAG